MCGVWRVACGVRRAGCGVRRAAGGGWGGVYMDTTLPDMPGWAPTAPGSVPSVPSVLMGTSFEHVTLSPCDPCALLCLFVGNGRVDSPAPRGPPAASAKIITSTAVMPAPK